jgi:AcrR family transcriptional regulator
MARRLDRRVQRTRKLLREALLALILEEGYDAISIQDITDKANLGRATFYLHFKDKDELLLEVMDEFIQDFLQQVPQLSQAQWRLDDSKAIAKIFDFAADHYDLYRILIMGSGGITASRQLQHTIAENIRACIEEEMETRDVQPIISADFIANHFAGSLLGTIYWWLDKDLPYTVEEMAEMFQIINKHDRDTLMGLHSMEQTVEIERGKRKKRGKAKENPKMGKAELEVLLIEHEDEAGPVEVETKEEGD